MAVSTLRVKNWTRYQHYKDRCPPWIKLATDTFQNYEFSRLQDASKLLAICIWTLASRSKDGSVPNDFEYLKGLGRLGAFIKQEHLKELINQGFVEVCSEVLADCKQSACSETETEERQTLALASLRETEKADEFDQFWKAYPRKVKRGAAQKAWSTHRPPIREVLTALIWQRRQTDWTKDRGQFIPYPASYLNAAQWLDEPPSGGSFAPTRPPGPPVAIAELAGERARQLAERAQAANQEAAERFKQQRESDGGAG